MNERIVGKRVLFVAPQNLGLYKDVTCELKRQGYDVVYIEDKLFHGWVFGDPLKIHRDWYQVYSWRKKESFNANYWAQIFSDKSFDPYYDYLLVIDGFSICDTLISRLTEANPKIKKILYLYDSMQGAYHFDRNLHWFEKVYTFDIDDSEKFSIGLLPIYWVNDILRSDSAIEYDVFGLASFGIGLNRYNIYKEISKISDTLGLKTYIKLLAPPLRAPWKMFLKKIFRLDLSLTVEQRLVTRTSLTPIEFREKTLKSYVILDALSHDQTGPTTRFSWAIGAGKKIITSNVNMERYSFYDSDQVFIFHQGDQIPMSFFERGFVMKESIRKEVDRFRIDNWVKSLLS